MEPGQQIGAADPADSDDFEDSVQDPSEAPGWWCRLWDWLKQGEDQFPPQFTKWDNLRRCLFYLLSIGAAAYSVLQFGWDLFDAAPFCDYLALVVIPLGVFVDRYVRGDRLIHQSRLEDPSEVRALLIEARTVEPRISPDDLNEITRRPENYQQKHKDLQDEVERLEELKADGWTDFQILTLSQMLVDFLKVDDLKERAQSSLDDLEEYAIDSAVSYDLRKYDRWKERIQNAIAKIDEAAPPQQGCPLVQTRLQDLAAEPLRAILRTLLEHVANYRAYWAEGSAILKSMIISCAVTIPVLFAVGLLPLFRGDGILRLYNWGFLGVAGALTGVLQSLRKSDVAEVGVTEGKRELWRTVIGGVLGLVSGILAYALMDGTVFATGLAVPDVRSSNSGNVALSILWAVGAGFSFERIFDRLRAATSVQGA